jgi:hypothetical protein
VECIVASSPTPANPGELHELGRGECLRLLADGVIGRVAFTDAALPAVQPVGYHLDDEEIIFRTRNGGKLAAATRHAVVGFEVDDFDACGLECAGHRAGLRSRRPGPVGRARARLP